MPTSGAKKPPLAASLRAARRAADLSQAALARFVGVHEQTVSQWERGVNVPTGEKLSQVAAALGTTPEQLLAGEGRVLTRPAPGTGPPASSGSYAKRTDVATHGDVDTHVLVPVGAGLSDYARGVLHAARQMTQTVAALIDEVMGAPGVPRAQDAPPPTAVPPDEPTDAAIEVAKRLLGGAREAGVLPDTAAPEAPARGRRRAKG